MANFKHNKKIIKNHIFLKIPCNYVYQIICIYNSRYFETEINADLVWSFFFLIRSADADI